MEFSPYASSETLREFLEPGRPLEIRAAGLAGIISGLDPFPCYDRELLEKYMAATARRRIREDLLGAQLLSALLRRLSVFLDTLGMPSDAGFRSEAVLIAEKILGNVEGRSVLGEGPLVETLQSRGAVWSEGEKVDILVFSRGAGFSSCRKALLVFGSCPGVTAEYRFTFEELDEVTRAKVLRYHSRDMAKRVGEIASAAAADVGFGKRRDMGALLAKIQEGVNPHLRDTEAERAVLDFLERKLTAMEHDEAAGVAAFFGRILPVEERMGE